MSATTDDVQRSATRDAAWGERLAGVVPAVLRDSRVVIAGCGSVGSYMADELARAGVSRFVLIDPEAVAWQNLTRTVYGHTDVGRPKVDALREHLERVFPDLVIDTHATSVQQLRLRLRNILRGADLLLVAVDDPSGIGLLNRIAYALAVPAIFVGVYRRAQGGEAVVIDPQRTPCFNCATGGIRDALEGSDGDRAIQRDRDYDSNRLIGEVALGSDIHFVGACATKLCLSMLARHSDGPLKEFADHPIERGVHYLMVGMAPDFAVFHHTHSQAMAQHAFQSLWLKTTRQVDCPVCGDAAYRLPID